MMVDKAVEPPTIDNNRTFAKVKRTPSLHSPLKNQTQIEPFVKEERETLKGHKKTKVKGQQLIAKANIMPPRFINDET